MTNTVAEQVPPLAHYRLLGNSGLRVSPLCLGCMGYGKAWQDIMGEHTEPEAILDTYVEAGGNFLDMANKYNEGETEEIIGEWMKKRGNRDRMVIATKFSIGMRKNDPNAVGNHRKNMFSSVRDSLRRLQTDYIDLLYVHFWDFTTPIEEVMSSFHDLVSAGKVHYVAFSDTPAWVVAKANTIAEFRGWPRVAAYQGRYSLSDRTMERELIPMLRSEKIAHVPWGVLGQGKLTGKYQRGMQPKIRGGITQMTEKDFQLQDIVTDIAKKLNVSNSQIVLAWMLNHQPGTIPIVGCRTTAQLKEHIQALNIRLDAEQMKRLNDASAVDLGFPHDFIGQTFKQNPIIKYRGNENIELDDIPLQ